MPIDGAADIEAMHTLAAILHMTLAQLYFRSVVCPGILLIPVTLIVAMIENRNYETEWMTKESVVGLTLVVTVVHCLIICLLSLTIFLNRYGKVAANSILSALSWFLLPGGFICAVVLKALNEHLTVGSDSEVWLATTINLPFIVGLAWGFWRYQKQKLF